MLIGGVVTSLILTWKYVSTFSDKEKKEREIENIIAFSKVYGYVKYFYPSDENTVVPWDKFAIYGVERVKDCNSELSLIDSLNSLFKSIAPSLKFGLTSENITIRKQDLLPKDTTGLQPVFWQHQGLGLEKEGFSYKSLRAHRKAVTRKIRGSSDGAWGKTISISDYQGLPYRLKVNARKIEGEGSGKVWLRNFSGNHFGGSLEYIKINETEWAEAKISGIIDDDGKRIRINLYQVGSGESHYDNVLFEVKVNDRWKTIYQEDFENNKVGYIRGDYSYKVDSISKNSFLKIESVPLDFTIKEVEEKLFLADYPAFGTVFKTPLTSDIKMIMPLVLMGNEKNTFPIVEKRSLDHLLTELNNIPDVKDLSARDVNVRLGSVIILWNVMQHFFPNFNEVDVDWNQALKTAVVESYSASDYLKLKLVLETMLGQLKDGHGWVKNSYLDQDYYPLPIEWDFAEKKLIITDSYENQPKVDIGDEVILINNNSVKKHFDSLRPYIQASSFTGTQNRLLYRAKYFKKDENVTLLLKKKNGEIVKTNMAGTKGIYKPNAINLPIIKELDKKHGVYYVDYSRLSSKVINDNIETFKKAKGIICDLRGYPRTNDFLKMLLEEKDTVDNWMNVPIRMYPNQENVIYDSFGWKLKPKSPHIEAKVVFITNGKAISWAESQLAFIKHYGLATIVGEPTAGANGGSIHFHLPANFDIRFTGLKATNFDQSQHFLKGVKPDIEVKRTVKGIQEQRDELLEAALQVILKE